MATVSLTSSEEYRAVLPDLLPEQGGWSEEEYLVLTDPTRRLVEYTDGYLEVLPMPTDRHQTLLKRCFRQFDAYAERTGGIVLFAPLRLRPGKFREPDIVLLRDQADQRRSDRYWTGADLVLEVVSQDRPERDRVEKRADYAEAGIPEYWIVHPGEETVRVLRLREGRYEEIGCWGRGHSAGSELLDGFEMPLDTVFG